jgi:hypothetical protein
MRVSRAEAGAICRANVRYGSLADIAAAPPNVRFPPDSDQCADSRYLLGAICGLMHRSKATIIRR